MIAIINVSEDHGLEYGKGAQRYLVTINNKKIVHFYHTFEEGLAKCLLLASLAVQDRQVTMGKQVPEREVGIDEVIRED